MERLKRFFTEEEWNTAINPCFCELSKFYDFYNNCYGVMLTRNRVRIKIEITQLLNWSDLFIYTTNLINPKVLEMFDLMTGFSFINVKLIPFIDIEKAYSYRFLIKKFLELKGTSFTIEQGDIKLIYQSYLLKCSYKLTDDSKDFNEVELEEWIDFLRQRQFISNLS